MERRVVDTRFKEKLYRISMEAPGVWRDLKRMEYGDMEEENEKVRLGGEPNEEKLEDSKEAEDREAIEGLLVEAKYGAAKGANKSILKKEKSAIFNQQEEAARKIGKTAKVKFDINDKKAIMGDSVADEYLDLMDKQGRNG